VARKKETKGSGPTLKGLLDGLRKRQRRVSIPTEKPKAILIKKESGALLIYELFRQLLTQTRVRKRSFCYQNFMSYFNSKEKGSM
jgi:hypothetical protein